jgi:hypothetical protein
MNGDGCRDENQCSRVFVELERGCGCEQVKQGKRAWQLSSLERGRQRPLIWRWQ